jgi:hypothetical protein
MPVLLGVISCVPVQQLVLIHVSTLQVSREILEERKAKELRKIESAVTLEVNLEHKVLYVSADMQVQQTWDIQWMMELTLHAL